MTKIRDVVRMKIPFPTIKTNLAMKTHMYVCIEDGGNKRFLSCQTKKPSNLKKNKPPYVYIDENSDINRNPFNQPTLIGCDYAFGIGDIRVDKGLLTTTRRDVCEELFDEITSTIMHSSFHTKRVKEDDLLKINGLLKRKVNVI